MARASAASGIVKVGSVRISCPGWRTGLFLSTLRLPKILLNVAVDKHASPLSALVLHFELGEGETLVSRQAESDQPHAKAKFLQPSKEVAERMRAIRRDSFHDLLKRAAQPIRRRASKAK